MNISTATEDDVQYLDVLINSAYRGEYSKKGWTTEADLLGGLRIDANSLKELVQKPNAVFLKCCYDNGEILGCVYLEKQDTKMYLGFLTVSPILQASGIGKQLLAAAEKYTTENNCISVYMTVISLRKELVAWYERHGYNPTGETKPFPTDEKFGIQKQPLELMVMEKML